MDAWGYQHGIQLDIIRPERPVENGFIETFNGRLRDEWLNVEVFIHSKMCGRSWLAGRRTTISRDRTVRSRMRRRYPS
jgi:putative transposase